jgi:hypothetical protein
VATPPDAATVRRGVEELRRKRAEKDAAEAKAKADTDAEPDDEPDDGDQGGGSNAPARRSVAMPSMGKGDWAGFLFGAVLWCWVGLPLVQGGPSRVKDVLRAKFTNKDAKGNYLP